MLRMMEVAAARMAHDENRTRAGLEAATRQDPTQPEPWLLLAQMHHRAHRDADELRALREVVRLDQHDRESLRRLFELLAAQNAWNDIRQLAEHARNLDPETADTHVALARAFAQTNGRDDAIFEYESALALRPEHPAPIHVALARLYLAANNRTRATAAARAALQAAPADPEARAVAQQLGLH
jgi:Tfp pilus assembly protein PilF